MYWARLPIYAVQGRAHQDARGESAVPPPHLHDVQRLPGAALLVVANDVARNGLRVPWLEQLHRRQPRPLHSAQRFSYNRTGR